MQSTVIHEQAASWGWGSGMTKFLQGRPHHICPHHMTLKANCVAINDSLNIQKLRY